MGLHRLRRMGFAAFYRLPASVRRRLVRFAVGKYIVGAVALVWDTSQPRQLLLLRQPPGRGWGLPAGLLRRGERPVEGCARELAEESGVRLSVDDLTPASPSALIHHRGRWVDVVFEATVNAAEVTLQVDGAEVFEAAFFPVDALPPLTRPAEALLGRYGIGPGAEHPQLSQAPRTPEQRG
jgi:ADP-ribose pyrophosphatase YjhB (NUDIX family)